MLYLFSGTDVSKARAALRKTLDGLIAKKADASLMRLEGGRPFGPDELSSYITGQGLFQKHCIVVLDNVLKDESAREEFEKALPAIAESANIFLVLEEKVSAPLLKKLEKHAAKALSFEKAEKKETFNVFALADALGKRDRKQLWVLYQKAKRAGLVDEQLHGTLLWQVRAMLLARRSKDAKESGLSPFVFGKAERYEKNYPGEELPQLSERFVSVFHDVRRGEEFPIGFERLLLSV